MDFANPFRFRPEPMEGIVVVRPPRAILPAIRATLVSILGELKSRPLKGMLWIIEPGRIRVYYLGKEEGHPTSPKRQRVNGWSEAEFTRWGFGLV
jgi:hypothetical protein